MSIIQDSYDQRGFSVASSGTRAKLYGNVTPPNPGDVQFYQCDCSCGCGCPAICLDILDSKAHKQDLEKMFDDLILAR